MDVVRVVGPSRALEIAGVKLVGATAENGRKLIFSLLFVAGALVLRFLLRALVSRVGGEQHERGRFWMRQAVGLFIAGLLLAGMASIWFDDPTRLATALGLVTAGLAFALQRVVTALAGYLVILRGSTFSVGDRITMGGVRGDVVALSFIQTTIMEMGQPPSVQEQTDPAMWVRSRQYTGRMVTISNAKIFDEAVYNYTREFPYIWEEMTLPVPYRADRARAEQILLDVARRHATDTATLAEPALQELERRYVVARADLVPRVFWRMTDNWLELTVRFLAGTHGIRDLKDSMTRDILGQLDAAGIEIASATYEIVGVPPLRVSRDGPAADRRP
jgi:small-conductance mechanosensitive channel